MEVKISIGEKVAWKSQSGLHVYIMSYSKPELYHVQEVYFPFFDAPMIEKAKRSCEKFCSMLFEAKDLTDCNRNKSLDYSQFIPACEYWDTLEFPKGYIPKSLSNYIQKYCKMFVAGFDYQKDNPCVNYPVDAIAVVCVDLDGEQRSCKVIERED